MVDMTSIVWGGVPAPVTFGFQAPSGNCDLYGYGANYCLPGCNHTGIDIGLAFGTTLYAVADGEITCAGTGVGPGAEGIGCGAFNCIDAAGNICGAGRVELLLDDGTVAIYGHCSAALVSVGQRVRRGEPIARSGEQNGPHLHFEQRVRNSACAAGYAIVDPEPLLTAGGAPSPGFVVGDTLAVDASDGLNLREGPGLSYPLITTMPWNRKAIVVSGPTVADGYHWYQLETRHGRGWAAGQFMKRVTLREYLHNPTANSSLSSIVPNRQQTTLERVDLAGSYRVKVINPGTGTMEGVRYESLRGLAMSGQQYFGGLFHQLKGTPGDVLDYVRVSIFYTDGTGSHSPPYRVTLDGTWQHVVPFHVASDPAKTIDWVAIRAIRNSPRAMTFYTDNASVVEL